MRYLIFAAGILIALCLGTALAFPALAASSCPTCFGFTRIGDDVYVEREMSPSQRAATAAVVAAARERVGDFYGSKISHPRILVCASARCFAPLGGGARGLALLDQALILSPRGDDLTIASHELAHVELHARLGWLKTLTRAVPQWFDEGLAVNVSDDRRYLRAPDEQDRCTAEPGGAMPTTRAAWIETAQSANLYARAACRVSRWISAHGGASSIPRLAAAVRAGESFEQAAR